MTFKKNLWNFEKLPNELGDIQCLLYAQHVKYFAFSSTVEEVDQIIEALNPRGFRESELKDKLVYERDSIIKNMKRYNSDIESKLQIKSNHDEEADESMEDVKEEKNHTVSSMGAIFLVFWFLARNEKKKEKNPTL